MRRPNHDSLRRRQNLDELRHRLKYASSDEERSALRAQLDFWQRYR